MKQKQEKITLTLFKQHHAARWIQKQSIFLCVYIYIYIYTYIHIYFNTKRMFWLHVRQITHNCHFLHKQVRVEQGKRAYES